MGTIKEKCKSTKDFAEAIRFQKIQTIYKWIYVGILEATEDLSQSFLTSEIAHSRGLQMYWRYCALTTRTKEHNYKLPQTFIPVSYIYYLPGLHYKKNLVKELHTFNPSPPEADRRISKCQDSRDLESWLFFFFYVNMDTVGCRNINQNTS